MYKFAITNLKSVNKMCFVHTEAYFLAIYMYTNHILLVDFKFVILNL
jgi:hypothetical protein